MALFSDLAIAGEFENFNAGLETFGFTFSEWRRDSFNFVDLAALSFEGVIALADFELKSMGKITEQLARIIDFKRDRIFYWFMIERRFLQDLESEIGSSSMKKEIGEMKNWGKK